MDKNKLKITNASKYFNEKEGVYHFPFEVLDKTPGGTNLGRIEWCIEPIISKKKRDGLYPLEKIYLWAKQTRDKRYAGKTFEIPCYAESILSSPSREGSFLGGVWRMGFCPIHKTLILESYPNNDNYKELIIRTSSSIGVDIDYIK